VRWAPGWPPPPPGRSCSTSSPRTPSARPAIRQAREVEVDSRLPWARIRRSARRGARPPAPAGAAAVRRLVLYLDTREQAAAPARLAVGVNDRPWPPWRRTPAPGAREPDAGVPGVPRLHPRDRRRRRRRPARDRQRLRRPGGVAADPARRGPADARLGAPPAPGSVSPGGRALPGGQPGVPRGREPLRGRHGRAVAPGVGPGRPRDGAAPTGGLVRGGVGLAPGRRDAALALAPRSLARAPGPPPPAPRGDGVGPRPAPGDERPPGPGLARRVARRRRASAPLGLPRRPDGR
jgi:hypothetical protein